MGLDPSLDTYTALACAYAEKGDIENINQVCEPTKICDVIKQNQSEVGNSQTKEVFPFVSFCFGNSFNC